MVVIHSAAFLPQALQSTPSFARTWPVYAKANRTELVQRVHFAARRLLLFCPRRSFYLTTNPSSNRQHVRKSHRHHQDVCRAQPCPLPRRVRNCDAVGPLNAKNAWKPALIASVLRDVRNGSSECEAVREGTLVLGDTQHSRRRPLVAHRQTTSA
jgi:hypothetical protein